MTVAEFYRQIAFAQAEGAGLPGLTRLLMKQIQQPVIISDLQGRVLSWHSPVNVGLTVDGRVALPSALTTCKANPASGVMVIKGKRVEFLSWPIGGERKFGYVFVIGKSPMQETFGAFAEIVGLAAMVEISKQREIVARERVYRDEFVRDILFNNFDGLDDMIRAGRVWGFDSAGSHIVMVIEPSSTEVGKGIDSLKVRNEIEFFLSQKASNCLVGEMANCQVVLLSWSEGMQINWRNYVRNLFEELLQNVTISHLAAGVGQLNEDTKLLYRSYQQAKVALELGKLVPTSTQIAFFDELGAVRLFYNQSEQDLEEFFQESIGVLEEYDRENNGNLLITLWHYLRSNRDTNTAKDKLFIHSNTLRYRLRKIEELLGTSLEKEETRFNLFAALKVASILGKLDPQFTKSDGV